MVIETLGAGGREIAMVALVRALRERGWDARVVGLCGSEGNAPANSLWEDLPVVFLQPHPKILRVPLLVREIHAVQPQVVHTHLFSGGLWGRIAARIVGVPVIVHTHGGFVFRDKRWKRVPVERVLAGFSDRVISVSESLADHLVRAGGLAPNSITVIRNGINCDSLLDRPLRKPSERPTLFSAGRFTPVKGYDLLIRALPLLKRTACRIVLAGDGPERQALERLAGELGCADRVTFLGYRHDVRELLATADVYVAPSRSEGMSNAIIEAMAAGVPVVATAVGGNTELLADAGRLVAPEDPAALARGIEEALLEHDQTREFIGKARNRVRRQYTMDRVTREHEVLYHECLADKGIEPGGAR